MTPPRHRASLLTPPGTGAIAVIEVVGTDPLSLLRSSLVSGKSLVPGPAIRLDRITDDQGIIDEVLLFSEEVSSGTVLEISCHGGVRVVERILALLERNGAEVVQAAFPAAIAARHQNKLDQEALAALAGCRTMRAARFAARLRTELPRCISEISAMQERADMLPAIQGLAQPQPAAKALLGGVTITLVGPPNSGKSTLFNALLGRTAVVTSPIPGTTRDWVREAVEWNGVPINLVDTAGRHPSRDLLERMAIEAGVSQTQASDISLVVLDASIALSKADVELIHEVGPGSLVVANKSDLGFAWTSSDARRIESSSGTPLIRLSAIAHSGCELLKSFLLARFQLATQGEPALCFFTDRQVQLVRDLEQNLISTEDFFSALLERSLAKAVRKAL